MMNRFKRKSITTKQVVFKVTIELDESIISIKDDNVSSDKLEQDRKYWFANTEKKVRYYEKVLKETLEKDLKFEVNKHFEEKPIETVKIISVNEGSILGFFTVEFVIGTLVGNVIYDLIKYTAKELLKNRLGRNYFIEIDVDIISLPIIRNSYEEKGAFFYYLLHSNFFLMGIVFGGIVLGIILGIIYLIR